MKTSDILSEAITGFHSTTPEGSASIDKNGFKLQSGVDRERLFPNSISFTPRKNSYGGSCLYKVKLDVQESEILRLTMSQFWKISDSDDDTPVIVGKLWQEKAVKDHKKVIIIKGVPYIGTEICVLDPSIVKASQKL